MSLRTVVVDDAPSVAALHGMFVTAHPACALVGSAASGPDAVALIRAEAPDLVLLDVHLPGFSGIDVLRDIRADAGLAQPDVIAVTAARDVDTIRDARMMGVRHYLVKPFSAHELHQRIDDVLRERAGTASVTAPLDQRAVDALMQPAGRRTLPKGLTDETLQTVARALEEAGEASASQIADRVGLSRVSCRRYLEHLADGGSATRALDYATAGRPGTRYRFVSVARR
ncbi:response regulator [Microbacterium invictum]|uniref:Transcriptional regulatory protein n=1 Tax=Microbacterium invictum TaxID=515415 RepID=A0ABZ0VHT4_9MICO|nr:response regulator [Microbacterium invictum]WQB71362.1 response regulator [Microbacterium invictum]